MSLQMGFVKKLEIRKDKVKCVDFHPSEPWVVSGLYSGACTIYNIKKQSLVKRIEVCNSPVRCCKFIARKQWLIAAGDEMCIWVYNYNSLEKVAAVEGHTDYVRYLDVHPTLPYVLSCSDDMTIMLWDVERDWERLCVYDGHQHYVMMVKWSPKDVYTFASCSLDHTIKFWGVSQELLDRRQYSQSSPKPFFTLKGHTRGVNCIDFSAVMANPYIVSGSDDGSIRVWDYQTKLCLQVLSQHTQPVTCVLHHPRLPLIVTAGEDSNVNIWHSSLYKLKRSTNFSVGKIWTIACDATNMAIGSDQSTLVVQFGGERPLVSMHSNKLVMVNMFDIVSCNLSSITELDEESIGKPLSLDFRNIGHCEFFPQYLSHHPNGRYICLCGESEYVIYTAQGMRSKTFGKAAQVVWSFEGDYATWDGNVITIHHDFAPVNTIKPDLSVLSLHGGRLLGVSSSSKVQFYDWNSGYLVRTIDAAVSDIWWNVKGTKVALGCVGNCYILKYNSDALASSLEVQEYDASNGVASAFELEGEIMESVSSATWAMDTFVFVTAGLHLNLWTAGASEIFHYLDRPLHMIGHSPQSGLLYLCQDDVVAFPLPIEYLRFHSFVASKMEALVEGLVFDGDAELDQLIFDFGSSLKERASGFLESVGEYQLALRCSEEPERHFELYLKLGKIQECLRILQDLQVKQHDKSRDDVLRCKWKRLGTYCLEQNDYETAVDCLVRCGDYSSCLLIYVVTGNRDGIAKIAELATQDGCSNIAFTCHYMLNNISQCIDLLHRSNRHSEAAIMARTFKPSAIGESFEKWCSTYNPKLPELEKPAEDEDSLELESLLSQRLNLGFPPASEYPNLKEAVHVDFRREDNPVDKSALVSSWSAGI
ncbi:Coatomer subunit beta'-1 [Babesia sp. Xinjiang]|uniref:Coatomer subunit beta'-1 n=1 Tax=Babesia sp. Xinjiang TaxID=462227 RepID=UPI000A217F4C|nr:Coatomer subunit beta'-1 [Babesia sp. Xinjiang]ORM39768.1 Coatomer subunit beta'-1 [Babesia sp. Xinjiang]